MSDIYFKLIGVMKKNVSPKTGSQSGMIGMSWASTGGEASALFNDKYLAADGIENVIRVLDDIETGHFPMLQFVELNACPGGCVGGVATVENPYIARVRLQALRRYLPVSQNRLEQGRYRRLSGRNALPERPRISTGRTSLMRDLDSAAMQKMSEIETLAAIPSRVGLRILRRADVPCVCRGCCAGRPQRIDECIVYMRERINEMAKVSGGGEDHDRFQRAERGAQPDRVFALPEDGRSVARRLYAGDLLSWVMGHAQADDAWLTIMSNGNIVAVATLADVSCVILCEGVEPDAGVCGNAPNEKGVNLLGSAESLFNLSARVKSLL